jgi:hypothetical protein
MANEMARQQEIFETSSDDRVVVDAKPHYKSDFETTMHKLQIVRAGGRYFAVMQQYPGHTEKKYEILKSTALGIWQRPCGAFDVILKYCNLMHYLGTLQG